MNRREYDISITVNERQIVKVIIDSHYEAKHAGSMSDETIVKLAKLLDGGIFPIQERKGPYEYFVTDGLSLGERLYKLVWLLEDDHIYIGIVNAYRRKGNAISRRKRPKAS
jgi:hypothetical protein